MMLKLDPAHMDMGVLNKQNLKMVYIAPMKALAQEEWLHISVLEPLRSPHESAADHDHSEPATKPPPPPPARTHAPKPRKTEKALASVTAVPESVYTRFMQSELARLRHAEPQLSYDEVRQRAKMRWATSAENPENRPKRAPYVFPEPRDADGKLVI